jgi:hypothetical protein
VSYEKQGRNSQIKDESLPPDNNPLYTIMSVGNRDFALLLMFAGFRQHQLWRLRECLQITIDMLVWRLCGTGSAMWPDLGVQWG